MRVLVTKTSVSTTIIECDKLSEAPFALAEHEEYFHTVWTEPKEDYNFRTLRKGELTDGETHAKS